MDGQEIALIKALARGSGGGTGHGIPSGGTAGQVLAKTTATDYDAGWVDQSGGDASLIRQVIPVEFESVETSRGHHDCTFIDGEIVSFPAPGGANMVRYINPVSWAKETQRVVVMLEPSTGRQLEWKSVDYKYDKLLVGNGRAIKYDEQDYTEQGARLYVFYDAPDWRNSTEAEINFTNCGDYDVLDMSSLGYKMYGFWGGREDTVYVSCNLFNDVYLIQLGAGTDNLGSGTYTAAAAGRYNGSYKVLGHWHQDGGLGTFAAHGGQFYDGDLYIATNDTTKCSVYRCAFESDGGLRFDELQFAKNDTANPNRLYYRYIDGMCIKDGKLYAQPLDDPTTYENGTTMLIAQIEDIGDKLPSGGTVGQVLTRTQYGTRWATSGGGGGADFEQIVSGTLDAETTSIVIDKDSDGNAFELKEAFLSLTVQGTATNTTNSAPRIRTNTNSASGGGSSPDPSQTLINTSGVRSLWMHLMTCGCIFGYAFSGTNIKSHINAASGTETIKKIFFDGTVSGSNTFGVGTTWTLYGKRA